MAELDSGDALLNVVLPVMLAHPALLAALFTMLGQVHALLMGLETAGVELDPRAWLLRYAVATLGPYFTLGLGYFFVTLSFVFGESSRAITPGMPRRAAAGGHCCVGSLSTPIPG